MGTEKQASKHGKNIGGFLQLFDWNAKSRKKLFSSKSDFPERSKQKKRSDGNLPMTRLQMLDEDEYTARSSFKGSSDYSCASSVTDEDAFGNKAPGVVARLMGLDSLPRSNSYEPNSTPLFDCRSLPGSYYKSENLEYRRDPQIIRPCSLQDVHVPFRHDAEPKFHKVVQRPLEKFQTEILPPKSAKAIPVTRNRLLSPMKSGNVIPPENAAHIMEVAARIIEPVPPAGAKAKLPLPGSSSAPFKVRDFKEKVQATKKLSKTSEGSSRSGESSAVKQVRGHCMNKSVNSPGDATALRIFQDLEESSSVLKGNRKSISLALQAKANVQKREGLNLNGSRTVVSLKETSEVSSNRPLKSQSVVQMNLPKKPSVHNSPVVLRPNTQKQNSAVDVEKLSSKSKLQGGKVLSLDSSSIRHRNSSKLVGSSKVSSRKLGSEVKDDKRQLLPSSTERTTSKKRSIGENCQSEKSRAADSIRKDKHGKLTRSRDSMDMPSSCWVQDSERAAGADVISFTFTAPITRSGPGSGRYNETGENCKIKSADSRNKRILLNSDGMSDAAFPLLGNNVEGKDTLSTLLEQKLKELAFTVELSKPKLENSSHGMLPGLDVLMSSTVQEECKTKRGSRPYSLEGQQGSSLYSSTDSRVAGQKCQYLVEEIGMHGRNMSEGKKFLDFQLPGPISVLEQSPFASSCSSSDTVDSNNTRGSKQCSSMQIQDILSEYSTNRSALFEREVELSESASSTSAGTEAKRGEETYSTLWDGKPSWEIEYVTGMLHNIELMYKNYVSGRASEVISPRLFDQLECQKGVLNRGTLAGRRLMFDCVSECMELRCRQYAGGGYELWAKGVRVVKRKDKLAEDVYKEICAWSDMGDFMVDELVDNDMCSRYGRWLDFEVEAFEVGVQTQSRILDSLIDEVVADILVL